jgi:ABC-2 type transport system permease protein
MSASELKREMVTVCRAWYLLRPINPLFHLLAEVIQPDALGEIIVGIILIVTSSAKLHISFGLTNTILFIILVLFGSLIYTSIKLLFASIAFWIKFSQAVLFMNYQVSDFAKYPLSIYSKWMKVILSFIIPFAFTAYYPAGYFVGKVNLKFAALGTCLVSIIMFAIAYTVWLMGIKAYESAGS